MREFSIQVDSHEGEVDLPRVISCLKPTRDFMTMRGRLIKLTKLVKTGHVTVFEGSCPFLKVSLKDGRAKEVFVGDKRTQKEIDKDLEIESRFKRRRGFNMGRVKGDLTHWILKGKTPAEGGPVLHKNKKKYVPQQRIVSRILHNPFIK